MGLAFSLGLVAGNRRVGLRSCLPETRLIVHEADRCSRRPHHEQRELRRNVRAVVLPRRPRAEAWRPHGWCTFRACSMRAPGRSAPRQRRSPTPQLRPYPGSQAFIARHPVQSILVCLAVLDVLRMQHDVTGKVFAIVLPITAFVALRIRALGGEHRTLSRCGHAPCSVRLRRSRGSAGPTCCS